MFIQTKTKDNNNNKTPGKAKHKWKCCNNLFFHLWHPKATIDKWISAIKCDLEHTACSVFVLNPFILCMVFILAHSISCRDLSCGFYYTHLPLKTLPNFYHVPCLAMPLPLQAVSALLSCVSPSSPSSIPSCRSYLSVSRNSPPQFVISAGCSICIRCHCLFVAPWGRTPVPSAPSPPPTPQAGVNIEYGEHQQVPSS